MMETIRFYKKQKKLLFDLVGKKNGKILLSAIRYNQPIMISERNAESPIDGRLYAVLKGLGAKTVKNAEIDLENNGELKDVYITYYNEKTAIQNNLSAKNVEGEEMDEVVAKIQKNGDITLDPVINKLNRIPYEVMDALLRLVESEPTLSVEAAKELRYWYDGYVGFGIYEGNKCETNIKAENEHLYSGLGNAFLIIPILIALIAVVIGVVAVFI